MYYILYNRQTLKVEMIYDKPLTAKVCDNFYEINGIAEYHGEIPKNNWLTVDNIREEIETWKEKEPNEQGKEVEVIYSKKHIVCDLVAHFYPKRELTEEQKAKLKEKKYKDLCKKYIREKYSQDDVEALYANYMAEPTNEKYIAEFNEFQAYRVECKARAKGEVYD